MTEEYIEKIRKRVSKIMYENRELFSIVDDIFISAEHYKVPEKDLEFYVRETINSRTGLGYIVRNKVRATNEIRFMIENGFYEKVEIALIKSILSEYFKSFPDNEDIKKFNSIEI